MRLSSVLIVVAALLSGSKAQAASVRLPEQCPGVEVQFAGTSGLPSPKRIIKQPEETRKLLDVLRELAPAPGETFQDRLGTVYLHADERRCAFPQNVALSTDDVLRAQSLKGPVRFARDTGDFQDLLQTLTARQRDSSIASGVQGRNPRQSSLSVSIRPLVADVRVGDLIPIEFTVGNVGRRPVEYLDRDYDRSGRMPEYQLLVQNESGQWLPAFNDISSLGGLSVKKRLASGRQFHKIIFINQWALIKAPGTYRVTGAYHSAILSGGRAEPLQSHPITIVIKPRSDAEMASYVSELGRELATAPSADTRQKVLERLAYTCSPLIVPFLLDSWYEADSGFWEVHALSYYVPWSEGIKRQIADVAKVRGLANGMQAVLARHLVSSEEMFPLIERSLAEGNSGAWANGALAAQIFANDAFTPRLVELARDNRGPARTQAIYALALNRTDESVIVLKDLFGKGDEATRKIIADAVRTAYSHRGVAQGRPLLESDFDERFRRPE
jgi:hypothetical protein